MQKQQGKVALVTGGASGIGLAIATRFANIGLMAICLDKSESVTDRVSELVKQGLQAEAYQHDLSDTERTVSVVQEIVARHGRIDVLVNNAGVGVLAKGGAASLEDTPLDEWERTLAVNLTSAFLLSREAFPFMKSAGWGRIINISSRAGRTYFVPSSGAAYSASKAGLIGLNRIIAAEGSPFGITSNVIAPGRFDTPMANRAPQAAIDKAVSAIPLGRIGHPDEIAATAEFLISDGAAYITGATIDVNGGAFMG